MKYNPSKIEKRWRKFWERKKIYAAKDFDIKPKYYALFEFPYPSGDGLHVGHLRPYIGMDIIARKRRMQGYNVLFPIGWDAFGLPTENYAIKTGTSPDKATKKNTDTFRRQIKAIGLSIDWDREINTTDPEYYKWTQWMFLQFFKADMAYKEKVPINWCTNCKIGLANEEVVEGRCERCGGPIERRDKEQWMLRITKYADQLLDGLKNVDYIPQAKIQQENWIGRSEGAEIEFPIVDFDEKLKIFTTRPDTIFGATYMVIAPEHELIRKFSMRIENSNEVHAYALKAAQKTEQDRIAEGKEKTGVELKGVRVMNPASKKKIPIWVADYVLGNVGTGAIMAVPAHDSRDHEFAEKFKLPIVKVVLPEKLSSIARNAEDIAVGAGSDLRVESECWEGDGELTNSGKFDGMYSEKAKTEITKFVGGKQEIRYRLRDWVFSRQRYWGEPIPLINCKSCGWVPVPDKDLPVELPNVKNYEPRDDGESPLASVESWVNTFCPICKEDAQRETDVMPNWAGSSWYYLAYLMQGISNFKFPISKYQEVFQYWMPVDWYNGGMEHTVLHLLYSRFWNRFFYDQNQIPVQEPYKKRTSHGLILAVDGVKMSKSKGNVVNPDDLMNEFGADALRLYEMFLGPFDQTVTWSERGILGTERFLKRVWDISDKVKEKASENHELERALHKTIQKISDDIESMSFNTAVSTLMIFVNTVSDVKEVSVLVWKTFLILLAPFAPYIVEELWEKVGEKNSIHKAPWPAIDKDLLHDEIFELVIQVNGRVRATVTVEKNISQEDAERLAYKEDRVRSILDGKKPKKIIFIRGRLINFVI